MMDIHEVREYLPHRYPFLLVDRVVSVEPGKPLDGKPTLIATQSPGQLGGILSNYHLRQVLSTTGAVFLTRGEVAIPRMGDKVSDGRVSAPDSEADLG